MDRIRIVGGQRLNGTVKISGAKNAALPLMIASLLTPQTVSLENVPDLADVRMLLRILSHHGVDYSVDGRRPGSLPHAGRAIHLSARQIVDVMAPYELVSRMRASFWVVAPILARTGEAIVSLPGGCAIGTRPVDLLIMVLESLGARVAIEAGYVHATAPSGLTGTEIHFSKVTVGGTHTALMAASLARGSTTLINAACEPEIADVADCLNKMGAKIKGAGQPVVEIEGVPSLSGAQHTVMPDRIEAGTYAIAAAMTGGDIMLEGANSSLLGKPAAVIERAGAEISETNSGLRVRRNGSGLSAVDIVTAPFPGFPTD
ncbi:MAG: UDP-N-acetylglucosamine 1-carboxyvinyltransferase, partial [Methylocapsa sp.]|nr:UDP-N-acetylglucosamine 1-carboxyvinyltransferase [Methylocapsa sp.]